MDVHKDELAEDKVMKLNLAVKKRKDKLSTVKFKYEMQISELQINLQPSMPPKVHEQREINLKSGMASISAALVDCGELLDESMQIWTSL